MHVTDSNEMLNEILLLNKYKHIELEYLIKIKLNGNSINWIESSQMLCDQQWLNSSRNLIKLFCRFVTDG